MSDFAEYRPRNNSKTGHNGITAYRKGFRVYVGREYVGTFKTLEIAVDERKKYIKEMNK